MKKIIAACCLLFLAVSVYAQGSISGKIVDASSGSPIEYATVAILKATDSSLVNGTVSQSNGSFVLKAPLGSYILRVSFIGYNNYFYPKTISLSKSKPSLSLGSLSIKPSATTMQEVVVTAERSMVEYKLDKRVVNVDKNIVTGGGTATDVLETVPSVAVDNDGNVTLRGSTNVKVLIDGKPYELLSSDLETLLEQIPASTVEYVEVITNPSAKYDPEGMSGIINLRLKEKNSAALGLNGVASLNIGAPLAFLSSSYPKDYLPTILPTTMGSVNLNYSAEKFTLFFNADIGLRSRGMRGTSDIERLSNGVATSHDSILNHNANRHFMGSFKLGGEYNFDKFNTLLLSYQFRAGNRHRTSYVLSHDILHPLDSLGYDQTDTSDNHNRNHLFNLSYTHKFDNPDQKLSFDASFNISRRDGGGPQQQLYKYNDIANLYNYYLREAESHNQGRNLTLLLNYSHPFAFGWTLEVGYDGRVATHDQAASYYVSRYDALGSLVRAYDDLSSTHLNYRQQVHALYATFGGKIVEGLTAQAGLRGEYSNVYGRDLQHNTDPVDRTYWQLYPTLHFSYDLTKTQSLQLSYSRRVQRPHPWDLNPYLRVESGQQLSFGNPFLDPEFTNAFELSYNVGFDKVNLFASLYYRQTNNMMTRYGFVWNSETAAHYASWMPYSNEYDGYWASTWQNLSSGHNYGVELIADWQALSWWKLNLSVNLFGETIRGTELLNNQDRSSFRANVKLNSYMNLPKFWTIQLSGQYRSPFNDLQTTMDASFWFDLAVKKDVLDRRGTINLRISDIFCTGGFGHKTFTDQMNRIASYRRLSPAVTIGFTYKINNGVKPNRKMDMQNVEEADD